MGLYFGTDGLRGVFGKTLTLEMAFKCGRALASQKKTTKILIGRDTRASGDILTKTFALGAMTEGAKIVDVEVCPTAGISFLTSNYNFDFGVVISASHNQAEFNGIKIFDSQGKKLGDKKEFELEKNFFLNDKINIKNIGSLKTDLKIKESYFKFLIDNGSDLSGLKIVIDCANGAACEFAKNIFSKLGAQVIEIGAKPNGKNINKDCGALFVEKLKKEVLSNGANMGFAFDGDSDRLIAVDECGNIINGDMIIYLFACEYDRLGLLNKRCVVGTQMTNMAIENALKEKNIDLIRADIGDKYVGESLELNGLIIGGEQCGHVFLKDKLVTGDGILNAILIAKICKNNNKKLSDYFKFKLFNQTTINIKVKNKNKILECKKLNNYLKNLQDKLKNKIRFLVRASGTEPLIRIMVEAEDDEISSLYAQEIKQIIEEVGGLKTCVE